jgi:hypothetical protein
VFIDVCVEQTIDLCNTLQCLGVPSREKSFIVNSNWMPRYICDMRYTMLSFCCVEAIASGFLGFYFLSGDDNLQIYLRKHWGYTQIKERLKSLLFRRGDTASIKDEKETFQGKGE